jgi:hypothetical protein
MTRRLTPYAILWVCLAVAPTAPLAAKEPKQDSLRAYVLQKQGRQAYGVYVRGKKLGWFIDEIKLGKYGDKAAAVHVAEVYIAISREGEKSVLEAKSTTYYSLEGDGTILFAEERKLQDSTETVLTVTRDKDQLVLVTQTKKRKTERRVPLPRETLGLMRKLDHWLKGNPSKGATFDNYSAAFDQDDVNVKEVNTFQGKKTILWGGVATEVYLVRVKIQRLVFDAQLRSDGTMLKGKLGGIFDIRAEKEATAKRLDAEEVDLLAASSIEVDRRLGNAKKVESLTLEASGLDEFTLPTSHRQRVKTGKDGAVIVELVRDRRADKAVPLTDPERKRYLRATPTLQSDDAKIRKLAKQIVGTEQDPIKMAGLLEKWVYERLRKTMAENASTALDVLENRAGDCTEHTLLFVALARAAGIPAREVGGLAYLDDPNPLFGWHAWGEIHDGHQWVTVDPTWNEIYVDATHIKFSEGSEDLGFINVIGSLKLKVVDFKTKK